MIKDVWSRQISLANDKYRITSHVNLFKKKINKCK